MIEIWRIGRHGHGVEWWIGWMGTTVVIALRWMGEDTRGAVATGWKVATRNEAGDFWRGKIVQASGRMAFTHYLRRWRWIKRASFRNRGKID